jgi:hypothetical protein
MSKNKLFEYRPSALLKHVANMNWSTIQEETVRAIADVCVAKQRYSIRRHLSDPLQCICGPIDTSYVEGSMEYLGCIL